MRAWIAAAVLLGLCPAMSARAGVHVGAGRADDIDSEGALVASLSWTGRQRHPWEVMAGYIGQRRDTHVPDAGFLVVGRRLAWRQWFAGGGVAWVTEDNDVLSGHAQFMTSVGCNFGRATLSLRHLSNGGTSGRNRGETFALLEFGF